MWLMSSPVRFIVAITLSRLTVCWPSPSNARRQASMAFTAIAGSGNFSVSPSGNKTVAAGATLTLNVTFTPTAGGAQTGTLAIANSTTATPVGTTLTGTGVTANSNLALGATITASGSAGGFPPSNVNDSNPSSYWEGSGWGRRWGGWGGRRY